MIVKKLTSEDIEKRKEELAARLRSFLEASPLYTKLKIDLSCVTQTGDFFIDNRVNVISKECSICGAKRDFKNNQGTIVVQEHLKARIKVQVQNIRTEIIHLQFTCTICKEEEALFFIESNKEEGWIRKIGQVPPFDISIPKEIVKELGQDAELYKRARMCMSQSHGVGACAYLRRLVENQINVWLKLIYELKEYENADSEELKKIDDAIKSRNFSQKTEITYQSAPKSLIVEGVNPFKLIHDHLSGGLHGLDEDRCTEIAVELSEIVEYVVSELNRENKSKKKFLEKIRKVQK
ncbi:hypothetical protein [Coleofasciculus sp. H7-2]|uniref:hypothetical protein n=1 Tax=Coleofasciculus sp. H7-2 TaxID=3351545 RepID=UPI00366B3940